MQLGCLGIHTCATELSGGRGVYAAGLSGCISNWGV